MATYYYDRHNIITTTTFKWDKYGYYFVNTYDYRTEGGEGTETADQVSGWSNFSFDSSAGFKPAGTQVTLYPGAPGSVYTGLSSSGSAQMYEVWFTTGTTLKSQLYVRYVSGQKFYPDQYLGSVSGQAYNWKQSNAVNPDGFYWIRREGTDTYSKGTYRDTVVAELGTFPVDGISGSYWYVLSKRVFPEMKIKLSNQLVTSSDGWVKVDGQLRQIVLMWVKIDGQLREV